MKAELAHKNIPSGTSMNEVPVGKICIVSGGIPSTSPLRIRNASGYIILDKRCQQMSIADATGMTFRVLEPGEQVILTQE